MAKERRRGIVGNLNDDYWIYDTETGFDLTRPSPPTAQPKAGSITLPTPTSPITIDPAQTALVIIDMQNFFLSPALGRSSESKGLQAEKRLLDYALPAARKAGIQVVWLNWGLTEDDLRTLPPAVFRAFGVSEMPINEFNEKYTGTHGASETTSVQELPTANELGKDARLYVGVGNPLGDIALPNGSCIQAGRMLMRDQWNTALTPYLNESYVKSLKTSKPDAWVHKVRMSGLHVPDTDANVYFKAQGFKTLLFAGVNTDQCVGGTLVDAFAQGYDCVMLSDGCATSSPQSAQECWEFNGAKTFGFVVDCAGFARGVEASISK